MGELYAVTIRLVAGGDLLLVRLLAVLLCRQRGNQNERLLSLLDRNAFDSGADRFELVLDRQCGDLNR